MKYKKTVIGIDATPEYTAFCVLKLEDYFTIEEYGVIETEVDMESAESREHAVADKLNELCLKYELDGAYWHQSKGVSLPKVLYHTGEHEALKHLNENKKLGIFATSVVNAEQIHDKSLEIRIREAGQAKDACVIAFFCLYHMDLSIG